MKQCCSYFCKLNNSLPSQSASEKHQLSAMNRRRNIQFRRRLILFFGIVIICLTLTGSIFLSNYYGETMNTTSLFIEPPSGLLQLLPSALISSARETSSQKNNTMP